MYLPNLAGWSQRAENCNYGGATETNTDLLAEQQLVEHATYQIFIEN